MTSASIAASRERSRRDDFLRATLDAWRGITWEQALAAFFFGNGVFVLEAMLGISLELAADDPIARLGRMFVVAQIMAFTLLLGLVVANRAADSGASRRFAYLSAVLASAAAGTTLEWLVRNYVFHSFATAASGEPNWIYTEPIENFVGWLLIGGFGAFIYAERRLAAQTMARLRTSQIERIDAARKVAESRLQEMQARVEPQFLFETLSQVSRLYEVDESRAERMLEALIGYLRAAMPTMRDTSSTLSRELTLVRAYLAIAKLRAGDRLIVEIDPSEDAADARMPAMTLLPIVEHALGSPTSATGARAIRVTAEIGGDRLRIVVAGSEPGFDAGSPAIDTIRERLGALYGDAARLELRRDGSAVTALLEIPFQAAGESASADDG